MNPWRAFCALFPRKSEPEPAPRLAPWTHAQQWHVFDWSDSEFSEFAGLFWVKQAIPVARGVHTVAFEAVAKWAEQAGQTPDEWIREWVPVVEVVCEEETLTVKVTPHGGGLAT